MDWSYIFARTYIHTFQPRGNFENAPSTALTIVCTINVSIDCKRMKYLISIERKIYLIVNQDNKLLGFVFCFKNKIVCKDDDFLAFTANENSNSCAMMYRTVITNGIDCCNNQTLVICIATTHFDWMGLKCGF